MKALANKYQSKELNAVATRGLSQLIVNTLGALVNVDSHAYYTSNDIAHRIMEKMHSISAADRKLFYSAVSAAITQMFINKSCDLHRTTKRIAHKLCVGGKSSYGYRIGMSLGKTLVTADTVNESRNNTECYERLLEVKFDTAKLLVEELSFSELIELQRSITRRLDYLHKTMLDAALVKKHLSQN